MQHTIQISAWIKSRIDPGGVGREHAFLFATTLDFQGFYDKIIDSDQREALFVDIHKNLFRRVDDKHF